MSALWSTPAQTKRATHAPHLHQKFFLCFLCLYTRKVSSLGVQLVLIVVHQQSRRSEDANVSGTQTESGRQHVFRCLHAFKRPVAIMLRLPQMLQCSENIVAKAQLTASSTPYLQHWQGNCCASAKPIIEAHDELQLRV